MGEKLLRQIFIEAAEMGDAEAREVYLNEVCAGDDAFRKRVESLLEVDSQGDCPETSDHPLNYGEPEPGSRIGPYRVVKQVGEGGCGVVYLAEQEEPVRRQVALKIIKLGMDTRQVIARFEAEKQALAMMNHPNIAKVLDAGSTESGRPYFVMELVEGKPITDYCDQAKLNTKKRLELFREVCMAVQHAHRNGIIHRDLKPSNVMVSLHEDQQLVKVIDFGIAKAIEQKLTEQTLFTADGLMVGTPAYMSPEQTVMSGLDIDTRTDVFSLGVMLYELLTGAPPIEPDTLREADFEELRRIVREIEPPTPSARFNTLSEEARHQVAALQRSDPVTLTKQLRGELDWIVMKAVEKDRDRRYESPSALAQDVDRYLDGEPVLAVAPSVGYKVRKFVRRNGGVVAAAVAIAVLLLAGTTVSTWQSILATEARQKAEFALKEKEKARGEEALQRKRADLIAKEARENLYAADMNLVHHALLEGEFGRARKLLEASGDQAHDLRGFEWFLFSERARGDQFETLDGFENELGSVVFLPHDPEQFVVATVDGGSTVHRRGRQAVRELTPGGARIDFPWHQVAATPDGSTLAVAGLDGIDLWRTADWSRIDAPALSKLQKQCNSLCFSPGGRFFAVHHQGGFTVWRVDGWSVVAEIPSRGFQIGRAVCFVDDRRLVIWKQRDVQRSPGGSVGIWELGAAAPSAPQTVWSYPDLIQIGAIASDGRHLAFIGGSFSVQRKVTFRAWDIDTGEQVASRPGAHTNFAFDLCIAPDGNAIYTAGGDHAIKVWKFPSLEPVTTLFGHGNEVFSLHLSADGKVLVSGGKDRTVKLWHVDDLRPTPASSGRRGPGLVSEDGARVLEISGPTESRRTFWIRDCHQEGDLIQFDSDGWPIAFPDSDTLVFRRWDPEDDLLIIERIATRTGETKSSIKYHGLRRSELRAVMGSADGRRFAVQFRDRFELWDTADRRLLQAFPSPAEDVLCGISPAGEYVLSRVRRDRLTVWHQSAPVPRAVIGGGHKSCDHPKLSPCGTMLATTDASANSIALWNLADGSLLAEDVEHGDVIQDIAFSPDGKTLISRNATTMRFRHVSTFRQIARFDNKQLSSTPWRSLRHRILGRNLGGNREFWQVGEDMARTGTQAE